MVKEIYKRVGTGLTPEEMAMLEEAEKHPLEYDEDSPKLTPEQLAQFKPVNFNSMEERTQAMKQ
jgi:hypothetical protein